MDEESRHFRSVEETQQWLCFKVNSLSHTTWSDWQYLASGPWVWHQSSLYFLLYEKMIPTGFVVSFCSILTSYCEPLGVTRRLWTTVGVRRRIDEKTLKKQFWFYVYIVLSPLQWEYATGPWHRGWEPLRPNLHVCFQMTAVDGAWSEESSSPSMRPVWAAPALEAQKACHRPRTWPTAPLTSSWSGDAPAWTSSNTFSDTPTKTIR